MAADSVPASGLVPGLLVLAAIAVLARLVGGVLPYASPLVLALGIGLLLGNLVDVPSTFTPGIDRHTLLLETGIVLLGASVSVGQLRDTGPVLLVVVLGTVGLGVVLAEGLSRGVFSLPHRNGSLLAAGASICGVSAVVAVARSIDADRETVASVAGAILLFDAVTLVAFPAIGSALSLPDRLFGVWAGLSMFSTGPVAAAGFAYSAEAGRWATITKLVRNAFIGVLAVAYTIAYARAAGDSDAGFDATAVWNEFPTFLVGFFLVAAVANAGLLSPAAIAALNTATAWLFALAFAGVGCSIRVREMRATGLSSIAVLLIHLAVVSSLSFLVLTLLF